MFTVSEADPLMGEEGLRPIYNNICNADNGAEKPAITNSPRSCIIFSKVDSDLAARPKPSKI